MKNGPVDDEKLSAHMAIALSVSSGMLGVCLTAIGLIGIVKSLSKLELLIDDLLAVDALLFVVVAVLSFLGMRTDLRKRWRGFGLTLDVFFCLGLVIMAAAAGLLAWVVF